MKHGFTAIIEPGEQFLIATCPEVPDAHGQGATKEECLRDLADSIQSILEYRREEALANLPARAEKATVELACSGAICCAIWKHAVVFALAIPDRIRFGKTLIRTKFSLSRATSRLTLFWRDEFAADFRFLTRHPNEVRVHLETPP